MSSFFFCAFRRRAFAENHPLRSATAIDATSTGCDGNGHRVTRVRAHRPIAIAGEDDRRAPPPPPQLDRLRKHTRFAAVHDDGRYLRAMRRMRNSRAETGGDLRGCASEIPPASCDCGGAQYTSDDIMLKRNCRKLW